MYKKLNTKRPGWPTGLFGLVLLFCPFSSTAQFSLTGQLRGRGEVRQGFGNLLTEEAVPASFISQRTRLQFGYKWDRLNFGVTLQDVRIWGQDASTISATDGNRQMLHEGWAEIILANKADTSFRFKFLDNLSFKFGRQELIYDDSRLIGNLDWLQQGRRFDMALIKVVHHGWQFDLGYAFNQHAENFTGVAYTPGNVPQYVKNDIGVLVPTPAGLVPLLAANGNSSASGSPAYTNPPGTNGATQNYKNFLSLYIARQLNRTKVSGLFFKDDFAKYRFAAVPAGGGTVYGRAFDVRGTQDRYTYGVMISPTYGIGSGSGKLALQGAYYQQQGEDRDGRDLNAYHYSLSALWSKGKWTVGPGYDVLSGNKSTTSPQNSKRFDPLYGTPHKFWGYMDFFYAGTGSPAAGLKNYYVKTKYTGGKFFLAADYHHFSIANALAASSRRSLGDELDLTAGYTLNKFTVVELGYSIMKATSAMSPAKGQAATTLYDKTPKWAYLMINIKPDFLQQQREPRNN